jgi:hypothetical protein
VLSEIANIKMYKTVKSPAVLYGCEMSYMKGGMQMGRGGVVVVVAAGIIICTLFQILLDSSN